MIDATREQRVLVLARTARDAANATGLLAKADLDAEMCRSLDELCAGITAGAGAALVTEEALTPEHCARLGAALAQQPPWSDFPFVVLTRGGPDSPSALRAMQTLGNVILLERPVRGSTCITAIRTALRARERQYQAREHLATMQDAERRKDEFLAMLGHELRNPLAPIQNATHLLEHADGSNPVVRFALEVVQRQVANLTRLVDDLLDVSRITRGKISLKREPLKISAVIARSVEIARPMIEAKRQQLHIEPPSQPAFVNGDLTRLTQVVANLLNNASKYTQEGGRIELSIEMTEGDVVIHLRDNGIGIAAQVLPRIFDLFVQADSSLDRSSGGLGIGLTLVRRIVEMHGGSVGATSEGTGKGSEFTVRLPTCAASAPAARPAAGATPAVSRRVLVVDDNIDAARTLAVLLRAAGHEVRTAHDAVAALAVLDVFAADACVLDIGLPNIDGYELAQRIRARGDTAPMLIALSGYGQARDRERGGNAGFDHYLVKPPQLELLELLLAGCRRERTASAAAGDAAARLRPAANA